MTGRGQLVFDLGHRAALGREDFLVAPCNADAVAWIDRWPDWPAPALAIYGPAGCGKTHLAAAWRARSGAAALSGERLSGADLADLLGAGCTFVLDDSDRGVEERALLHLYNMLAERGGGLLITGESPPARWRIALPDLRSRLAAAPAVAIAPPDDTLLAALLVKLFADRQVRVNAELVTFLVPRIERSFDAARRVVAALDAAALAAGRPATVPLARKVLGAELGAGPP